MFPTTTLTQGYRLRLDNISCLFYMTKKGLLRWRNFNICSTGVLFFLGFGGLNE